jgi:hypothetical protein
VTPLQSARGAHYFALCLSGCAGVAVLGARRPGVGAWNAVVLGLLAANLLPLAETLVPGRTLQLSGLRLVSVAAPLVVGILNYLPTRLGASAMVMLMASGLDLAWLSAGTNEARWINDFPTWGQFGVSAAAWLGFMWLRNRGGEACSQFDARWLGFRERFGFVWGERVRQQFNRSAYHHGWPVHLSWSGLRKTAGVTGAAPSPPKAVLDTLEALMKRFGEDD